MIVGEAYKITLLSRPTATKILSITESAEVPDEDGLLVGEGGERGLAVVGTHPTKNRDFEHY